MRYSKVNVLDIPPSSESVERMCIDENKQTHAHAFTTMEPGRKSEREIEARALMSTNASQSKYNNEM